MSSAPEQITVVEPHKRCSRCWAVLPFSSFPIAKSKTCTYRRSWCRDCLRDYWRARDERKRARLAIERSMEVAS